jgi:hypothetical protein
MRTVGYWLRRKNSTTTHRIIRYKNLYTTPQYDVSLMQADQ